MRNYLCLRASFLSGTRQGGSVLRTTSLEAVESTADKGQEVLTHLIDGASETDINMEIAEFTSGRADHE